MRPGLGAELAAVAGLAAALAVGPALSWQAQALVLAGAAMLLLAGWTWRRLAHQWFRPRFASSALAGFAGFAAVALASAEVGAATLVLAAAAGIAGAAARERARLRGAPIPAEGEARGPVVFEGTVHAPADPPRLPGTDRGVALWVARQGRRRWSSAERVELRGPHRKVWIDPARARVRGHAWVLDGALRRTAARALDGADVSGPVRVWSFGDGDPAYVVGSATLEDDPEAPSFRDPGRVSVFSGDLVIGAGRLADARRRAQGRLLIWSALAAGAGGLALAGRLGWW